jgi:vitamin B12 transporter
VDGVRRNDFVQNVAYPGEIPVQSIDRIEIVKGAASAAWGSALGGVVNIVTKNPDRDRTAAGLLSGSAGERATTDLRAELTGGEGFVGYYLTGGNLHSKGLRPNNGTDTSHGYGKVVLSTPRGGSLAGSLFYIQGRMGYDEGLFFGWPVHDDQVVHHGVAHLALSQPLSERLVLDLEGHAVERNALTMFNDVIDGAVVPFVHFANHESGRGGSGRLSWGDARRNASAGFEYDRAETDSENLAPVRALNWEQAWSRWAAYANGALSFGPVTILPGIRHDRTGLAGDFTSATVGATWQATERTLLRAYAARGFGLPFPDPTVADVPLMKINTVQGGVETEAVPYLWLKGTYFYNRVRQNESAGVVTDIADQERQGFEVEGRTVPWHGLSLAGGYTFTYAKNLDTGKRVKTGPAYSVPPHVAKLSLRYDNERWGIRGTTNGNYVWWNGEPGLGTTSRGVVWDAHLAWKVRPESGLSPELFASGRNLLSAVQTTYYPLYENAPRWFEGGVRIRF